MSHNWGSIKRKSPVSCQLEARGVAGGVIDKVFRSIGGTRIFIAPGAKPHD